MLKTMLSMIHRTLIMGLLLIFISTAYGKKQSTQPLQGLHPMEVYHDSTGNQILAIIYSGDAGWNETEKGISKGLSENQISVLGINSLRYFLKKRTPESASVDLGRMTSYYLKYWNKSELILIGYSFGADVLSFMVNRLVPELRSKIRLVVLIGPSGSADFVFKFRSWAGIPTKYARPVLPEVNNLSGLNVLCFYGEEEKGSIGPLLDTTEIIVRKHGGGHRVKDACKPIIDEILRTL